MKKLFINLGIVASVITPLTATIACSRDAASDVLKSLVSKDKLPNEIKMQEVKDAFKNAPSEKWGKVTGISLDPKNKNGTLIVKYKLDKNAKEKKVELKGFKKTK